MKTCKWLFLLSSLKLCCGFSDFRQGELSLWSAKRPVRAGEKWAGLTSHLEESRPSLFSLWLAEGFWGRPIFSFKMEIRTDYLWAPSIHPTFPVFLLDSCASQLLRILLAEAFLEVTSGLWASDCLGAWGLTSDTWCPVLIVSVGCEEKDRSLILVGKGSPQEQYTLRILLLGVSGNSSFIWENSLHLRE